MINEILTWIGNNTTLFLSLFVNAILLVDCLISYSLIETGKELNARNDKKIDQQSEIISKQEELICSLKNGAFLSTKESRLFREILRALEKLNNL